MESFFAAIPKNDTNTVFRRLTENTNLVHASSLHQAAASGNIAALAALLGTQTNLEARNELGLTPLQVAVQNGHLAAAAFLVDKGANINARDPDGNTMLLQTIPRFFRFTVYDRPPTNWLDRLGDNPRKADYLKYLTVGQYEQGPHAILQTVSFLLASGIDVTATNRAGRTAMQLALDGNTALFDDRRPLIKLLQGAGATVENRDAEGNTALHRGIHAVDANEQDAFADLVAAGADVNATNAFGKTPLHLAVEKIGGWDQIPERAGTPIQALIKAKANVNAQDNEGRTPLEILVAADTMFKPEATRALLDAGADPNLRDKHGRTAAHWLLSSGWPAAYEKQCLDLLVKAGANLNARDDDGKTPLHYLAGSRDRISAFSMRDDGVFTDAKVDFNARDNDGDTPLHIAARTRTRGVFDWLVKHGAGLDETNNIGETPRVIAARSSIGSFRFGPPDAQTDIFTAVRSGNLDALTDLIKADSQLANVTNQFGQTPLRVAVLSHRTNAVEYLEQHHARWDAVSAVMAGRAPVLRELLDAHPEEVAASYHGCSLLHLAVTNNDLECTKVLLDAEADVQSQDLHGRSPLGLARLKSEQGVVTVLRKYGATENIFDAAYTGDYAAAAALIRRDHALAIATNSMAESALAIASGAGQVEILKLLLTQGASAREANTRTGQTPLHVAACYNQTNTAELLLQHGAKPDVYDHSGFTPLQLAAVRDAGEMVALLLAKGAEIAQPTSESSADRMHRMTMMDGPGALRFSGETALHLAAFMHQTNAVRRLLVAGAPVNATDRLRRTPLDLASLDDWPPRTFWIRRYFADVDPLSIAEPDSLTRARATGPRQQAVIALLEKAGGAKRQPGQRPVRPGFPK